MTRITDDVKSLFKRVRTLLGAPIRMVELTDDNFCVTIFSRKSLNISKLREKFYY